MMSQDPGDVKQGGQHLHGTESHPGSEWPDRVALRLEETAGPEAMGVSLLPKARRTFQGFQEKERHDQICVFWMVNSGGF